MKEGLGPRNIEWIAIVVLVIVTLTVFLSIFAGMMQPASTAMFTNLVLLMIFGGQMLLGIILLRIYEKITMAMDKVG